MSNKDLIQSTKDIVVAMINNDLITASSRSEINKSIVESVETIYNKLVELNSKTVKSGKAIPTGFYN